MSSPKTRIQKGKELEIYVSEQLRLKGLDPNADRSHGSGSGNREKADINTSMCILGRNAGFECKNHKTAHMKEWWNQVSLLEKLGREPVLVYKLAGESLGASKAVIYLDTLLDLVRLANVANVESITEHENTVNPYKLKQAKQMISQAINMLKSA